MNLPELIAAFLLAIFGGVVIWSVASALLDPPLPTLITVFYGILAVLSLAKIAAEG